MIVNGKPREAPEESTLADLIDLLSLQAARVAIERNREVVRRKAWPSTKLKEGDRIEIVQFVGGGEAYRSGL